MQSAFGWTTEAVKDVARGDVIGVSYPYAVATAAGIGLKHVCAVCLCTALLPHQQTKLDKAQEPEHLQS